MTDTDIINQLSAICSFTYQMNDGCCVSISFYDEDDPLGGTVRRHPGKRDIIKLVSQMPCLKKLNIRKCKIGTLPQFITKSLEYVDISSNDLTAIPDWLVDQKNLIFLNLGANKLTTIPNLDNLPLDTLKIHKNNITRMPVLRDTIKSLNLFLNPLNSWPEIMKDYHRLEVLTIGVTKIDKITSLSAFKQMKWLTLVINSIDNLPDDICKLTMLEGLQLAKNRLCRLPEDIGRLINLRALTVYANDLESLPESFFCLNLQKLNIAKNRLDSFHDRVVARYGGIDLLRL